MKQWFPLILCLPLFFLVVLYFGWSLVPCCVNPDAPGCHWKASMGLSLATSAPPGMEACGMCLLKTAAVQRHSCLMLPTSCFLSELQFSPLPIGSWDNSALTLPTGDGSISPESQVVGLWMNNTGMERGELESQCFRLFLFCIFIGLCRFAQLLSPSNVVITW